MHFHVTCHKSNELKIAISAFKKTFLKTFLQIYPFGKRQLSFKSFFLCYSIQLAGDNPFPSNLLIKFASTYSDSVNQKLRWQSSLHMYKCSINRYSQLDYKYFCFNNTKKMLFIACFQIRNKLNQNQVQHSK